MADDKTEDTVGIALRHKLERKELQAKITNLRHGISKGDKKKKREISEQIAKLEADLDRRHEEELKEISLQNGCKENEDGVCQSFKDLSMHDNLQNGTDNRQPQRIEPKLSKAQKRRDKKAEQDRERDKRICEQDKLNVTGARNVEIQNIKAILREKKLTIEEIPSNGDCLYAAICHQLKLLGIHETVQNIRRQTAQLLREKINDFLPFLCDPESGDSFTEEKYHKYCNDIEHTAAWGGQLELQAACQFLGRPIEVIQGEGPTIVIGEEYSTVPLRVTYHRHIYGLGEHYNSTTEQEIESDEDGFS